MAPKAVAKPRQLRAASTQAPLSNLETSADKHATTLAHGGAKGDSGGSLAAAGKAAVSASVSGRHLGAIPRLTPAVQAAILQAVAEGIPFAAAAAEAGILPQTARRWLRVAQTGATAWEDGSPITERTGTFLRELGEAYALACGRFEASTVRSIVAAGDAVSKGGIPEWRAKAWALNNLPQTRQTYREYRELHVEQQGVVSHEHRLVAQLPMAEVVDLLPDEWRDLVPPLAISGTSEGQ